MIVDSQAPSVNSQAPSVNSQASSVNSHALSFNSQAPSGELGGDTTIGLSKRNSSIQGASVSKQQSAGSILCEGDVTLEYLENETEPT